MANISKKLFLLATSLLLAGCAGGKPTDVDVASKDSGDTSLGDNSQPNNGTSEGSQGKSYVGTYAYDTTYYGEITIAIGADDKGTYSYGGYNVHFTVEKREDNLSFTLTEYDAGLDESDFGQYRLFKEGTSTVTTTALTQTSLTINTYKYAFGEYTSTARVFTKKS